MKLALTRPNLICFYFVFSVCESSLNTTKLLMKVDTSLAVVFSQGQEIRPDFLPEASPYGSSCSKEA